MISILKCLKIRTFSNLPFKTKYNNTVVSSVNSNYIFLRGKHKNNCWDNSLIKSTICLVIFRQNLLFLKVVLNNWRNLISRRTKSRESWFNATQDPGLVTHVDQNFCNMMSSYIKSLGWFLNLKVRMLLQIYLWITEFVIKSKITKKAKTDNN